MASLRDQALATPPGGHIDVGRMHMGRRVNRGGETPEEFADRVERIARTQGETP